jgi:MoaA/NifB/PqqE/SkfB family radical SAM enzyme
MRWRREKRGFHGFDRQSGLHILVEVPPQYYDPLPRLIQVSLTSRCNKSCEYCYVERRFDFYDFEDMKNLLSFLDRENVHEVTFGGGEPLLVPWFAELLKWGWNNTGLGLGFTTNGTLLTKEFLDSIEGYYGEMRLSINRLSEQDRIRNLPLLKNRRWGLNHLLLKDNEEDLLPILRLAKENGAGNVLFLNYIRLRREQPDLEAPPERLPEAIEIAKEEGFRVYVSTCYRRELERFNIGTLFPDEGCELIHLDSDGYAGRCSFTPNRIWVGKDFYLLKTVPINGCIHQDLAGIRK